MRDRDTQTMAEDWCRSVPVGDGPVTTVRFGGAEASRA